VTDPSTEDFPSGSVGLGPSGFALDGREEALLCASLFYFRLPREVWEARLARVRATGYRVIDVYLPWNFHETSPGVWDFEGRRDVGAFLDLAHEAGLAVIARPGPYICSEWDGGALPAWLGLEEGLRPRQAEPRFLSHVRGWFDRAMPIIAARQWGRGGAVIAVQLENELDFFDTADRAAYMTALRDMAVEHGVEVPLVACAGQGDLVGASGGVDGVVPAFNFYPDDRSPFVDAEVRRYAELAVTETNRRHTTLRRLLVSGAKVIAPYLQASGFDFGYTPSVGNWGDPGGFMTHDYDFGGYLSPVGEARPEAAEARVLTACTRSRSPRPGGRGRSPSRR
jgi:beta-galactosidase